MFRRGIVSFFQDLIRIRPPHPLGTIISMTTPLDHDVKAGLQERLDAAHDMAKVAAEIIRHYFAAQNFAVEDKADAGRSAATFVARTRRWKALTRYSVRCGRPRCSGSAGSFAG